MISFVKCMDTSQNLVCFKNDRYLNLSVVTDSGDGNGSFEWIVRIPWLQLHYCLGSPHQTCHRVSVLQELFFLFLETQRGFQISDSNSPFHRDSHK